MSAIAGMVRWDRQSVEPLTLHSMLDPLAAWGPDGRAVWNAGPAGLGYLWFDADRQSDQSPVVVEDRTAGLAVVADVRLDDAAALARQVDLRLEPSSPESGARLILALWQRWGERCVDHLSGDFAFAIYDARAHACFCARDPLGVRPFSYFLSDRLFAFGSHLRALKRCGAIPWRLNPLQAGYYLAREFSDPEITFFQDVLRLPAGHALLVKEGNKRLWRYWNPLEAKELDFPSDDAYAAAFRERFTAALSHATRGATPVGSMLSGGLDSSSIVVIGSRLLAADGRGPLHTFSAIFPEVRRQDARVDEEGFMRAVTDQEPVVPHFVPVDTLSPFTATHREEAEAVAAPNLYLDHAIFRAAAQAGCRVLLTGYDGDSVVSNGYEYLTQLARHGRWLRLLRESRALARRVEVPTRRVVWRLGARPLVPEAFVSSWRHLRGRNRPPRWRYLVQPAFAEKIQLQERLLALEQRYAAPAGDARMAHFLGVHCGLLSYGVELLANAAARERVQLRLPFFNRGLVEFCLRLPPAQKLVDGWPRSILRRAMRDVLPAAVRTRTRKGHLSANFTTRLLLHETAALERLAQQPGAAIQTFVDPSWLRGAWERFRANPLRAEQDALDLFLVLTLDDWLARVSAD